MEAEYNECKAEVSCKNCRHIETEIASGSNIVDTIISPATCITKEKHTYVATFTNSLFEKQTKENIEVGEIGNHNFEGQMPIYIWNDNYTACKAEVKCKHCEHTVTEIASGTSIKQTLISEATCSNGAIYNYEAVFSNSLFSSHSVKHEEGNGSGNHSYFGQIPTYTWNDNYTECKAEVKCKHCDYKEQEIASGSSIVDTKVSDATCFKPELHKFEATFINELFSKQIKNNIEVGSVSHQVVTHEAKDPTKTEEGLSTTYYTCALEDGKYFSDQACKTECSADTISSYAIKSFDDLDAMLDGANGEEAYDIIKINSALAYMDEKYSATAKTAYGNGAVVAAKAKYDALYTGAELNLETADYWGKLGNYLLNGMDDNMKKFISLKGTFENTEYGRAYSFIVKYDYEDTDWAGVRISGFNLNSGTNTNVFYFYSVTNTTIGLIGWDSIPFITWDVVEGWNKIVVPEAKISQIHTASQFRLVIKGLKKTDSYYKITSVYGAKANIVQTVIDGSNQLANMPIYKAISLANSLKTQYDGLTSSDQAKVDLSKITAITNKYYILANANIYGSCDSRGSFSRVTDSEVGLAYKITDTVSITSSTNLFRINILDAQTGAINMASHVSSDTLLFYTYGVSFTDGTDSTLTFKKENGSDLIVGAITHKNLANGWVEHSLTDSRTRSLCDYIINAANGVNYLRFNFTSVPQGSTLYMSSFYGVHA